MTTASVQVHALIDSALVCDAIVPWTSYGDPVLRAQTQPRYRPAGFDFIGLSLCSDAEGPAELLHAVARVRREMNRVGMLIDVSHTGSLERAGRVLSLQPEGTVGP
jgi:hypothetical protein